jgi:hypothetical protein
MASKFFKAGAKVFEYLKPKPKVNETKLDKAKSKLAIAKQKTKGSKAKLKQTLFEIENKMPLTFKKKSGKSESNKEAYKRIQKDNTKVIKGMLDRATENKKDGGRMGLKDGSKKSGFGAQSVKYGLDKNYDVTKADKIAKFVGKKNKKKII